MGLTEHGTATSTIAIASDETSKCLCLCLCLCFSDTMSARPPNAKAGPSHPTDSSSTHDDGLMRVTADIAHQRVHLTISHRRSVAAEGDVASLGCPLPFPFRPPRLPESSVSRLTVAARVGDFIVYCFRLLVSTAPLARQSNESVGVPVGEPGMRQGSRHVRPTCIGTRGLQCVACFDLIDSPAAVKPACLTMHDI